MSSIIEDKIREHGQKRDIEALQSYIKSLSVKEITTIIEQNITNSNFSYTWNYILQGFTESKQSQQRRNEIVLKLLKTIDSTELTTNQANTIIHGLCMEVSKFSNQHLVKLCSYCIETFQKQKAAEMSWKELLPVLVNVVIERETVEVDGTEVSGLEYKHQIINCISMIQWAPEIITPITSMFIEMPLDKDEHVQIVNKLSQFVEKLTPQEIPAFIYQLLRLCKSNNSKIIFFRLQHYFAIRIYETLSGDSDGSDNTNFDSIETTNNQEVIITESTVLFHIHSIATHGHDSIKNYILFLKNLVRAPEFLLHPFQITVLLTISTISHYEEKIFDLLRSCIAKTYHEEVKRSNSAWYRDTAPKSYQIELAFGQIINLSAENRDLVLQGLVNFAFVLLSVGSGLGRDLIAEKQWHLGNVILFKVIKRKRHIAPVIIQQLSNRILTSSNVFQSINCLYTMTKNLPLLMLENRSSIDVLLEGIVQMPGNNAKLLLDAIIPLIKVSATIRDQFILILRKALYSRQTETRQMAVTGFLKLIINLKISNMAVFSQNSYTGSFSSGHSLFTQISINRTTQLGGQQGGFSNEALCLEILSILGRCFMQQAQVRGQLYEGLYEAVCQNPELGIPVLDAIWLHFVTFYNVDENELPPLNFTKTISKRDVSVIQQEPLAKLLFTIGQIINVLNKDKENDAENDTLTRFTNVFQSICKRMLQCDLVHFEFDDGTDYANDSSAEVEEKKQILKEVLSVYDALIGYKLILWENDGDNEHCKDILGLFQAYVRFHDFWKNLTKPKKTSKKKKDGGTTQSSTTDNSSASTSKQGGAARTKVLKKHDTVFDLLILVKAMKMLYEPVVGTSSQWTEMKTKKAFHHHLMESALNLLTSLKHEKIVDKHASKNMFGHLCELAAIINKQIIQQFVQFIDFDLVTANLALDCFLNCFLIVQSQFKANIDSFLSRIVGAEKGQETSVYLKEIIETYEKLLENEDSVMIDCNDSENKKVQLILSNSLSVFANLIQSKPNQLSTELIDWMKNYIVTNSVPNKQLASSLTNLLLSQIVKYKLSLTYFETISIKLGDVCGLIVEDADRNVEELKMVNEMNLSAVWIEMCNSIKTILEDIDWMIARLKSEFVMLVFPNNLSVERRNENLKAKERSVCCHLCFVVSVLTNLCNCTVPSGNMFEAVLKNVTMLFSTLSALTKHFVGRSTKDEPIFQEARFERVVKVAGKQLAPIVYKMILYIEETQKESQSTQAKKKNASSSNQKLKILKETRLIPKAVYEIEQFAKCITLLSKKTKVDLVKYTGQGTARDFRIMHLKDVLEKVHNEEGITLAEDDSVELEEADEPPVKKSKNR